ncbi:MAG: hypothetical protein ABI682_12440 [Acidobacteriota bacterium]
MNKRLTERGNAESVISHEDAWHFELLSECPNVVLIELIEQVQTANATLRDRVHAGETECQGRNRP